MQLGFISLLLEYDMNFKGLQRNVLHWYATNQRDLPWRKTTNPYHILVSEIMLQQTQVPRVIEKFAEFTATFPRSKVVNNKFPVLRKG